MRGARHDDDDAELGELIRFGTIAEVDLGAGRCIVAAGDVMTGPIRWLQPRAGKTRSWSPPSVGEQVILLAPEGELAGAIALLGMSSSEFPPAGDTLRELVQFEDGTVVAYDPEAHRLDAHLCAGGQVLIIADGGVEIRGDVSITGNVQVTGQIDATVDVVAASISLKSHKHGGVQGGAAKTGAPE